MVSPQVTAFLAVLLICMCRQAGGDAPLSPARPVSTYSIVARDAKTGELGVAVQSHWFSVGSVVPWAKPGVGAVATQSFVDPSYGPIGIELMSFGRSASQALDAALAADEGRAVRQVAMIDAKGVVAAHTGAQCIADAGHLVDSEHQFSVQANLMANPRVWPAMADAFREAEGDLAERMLAALVAAEAAGGDIRGRQSAALLVVRGQPTGKRWVDRRFDIRVQDSPQPLKELARLVQLQRAYHHMNDGDLAMERGDFNAANKSFAQARDLAPHIVEIPFWQAVTLANSGKVDASLPIFRDVFKVEPVWVDLIPRLVASKLLPDDDALVGKITAQRPQPLNGE